MSVGVKSTYSAVSPGKYRSCQPRHNNLSQRKGKRLFLISLEQISTDKSGDTSFSLSAEKIKKTSAFNVLLSYSIRVRQNHLNYSS